MSTDDRCTGHCCEEFTLTCGDSLDAIERFLRTEAIDGHYIANMIIPVRPMIAGNKSASGRVITEAEAGGKCLGWVCTCRHYDRETRNCTAYEERPLMCRQFPYGKACEHGSTCTWSRGRAGTYPAPYMMITEHAESPMHRATRKIRLRVMNEPWSPRECVRNAPVPIPPKLSDFLNDDSTTAEGL